jgi:hypothetical protein
MFDSMVLCQLRSAKCISYCESFKCLNIKHLGSNIFTIFCKIY